MADDFAAVAQTSNAVEATAPSKCDWSTSSCTPSLSPSPESTRLTDPTSTTEDSVTVTRLRKRPHAIDSEDDQSSGSNQDSTASPTIQPAAKRVKTLDVNGSYLKEDESEQPALDIAAVSVTPQSLSTISSPGSQLLDELENATVAFPAVSSPETSCLRSTPISEEKTATADPTQNILCPHKHIEYREASRFGHPGHCKICDYAGKKDETHHFIYYCSGTGCEFELYRRCFYKNVKQEGQLVQKWLDNQE